MNDNGSEIAERFIEVFSIAALQAGAVARHLRGEVRHREKNGGSPEAEAFSAADLAAQDVILHLLARAFPDAQMDAEEKTGTLSLFSRKASDGPLLVIDPIDGSLNYIRQDGEYAVMGACLIDGRFRSALVHFPEENSTYWAVQGKGAWKRVNGGTAQRAVLTPAGRRIFVSPAVSEAWRQNLAEDGFEPVLSRCSAVDATAPINGRGAASLCACRSDRRRAIGYLLTTEAGGIVRLGDRQWRGEDPETLPARNGPSVVAGSESESDRILHIVRSESSA